MTERWEYTLGDFCVERLRVQLCHDSEHDNIFVRTVMDVQHVDDGRPIEVCGHECTSLALFRHESDEWRTRFVKQQIMRALEHEVDEHLRLNGRLVTQPHPEESER